MPLGSENPRVGSSILSLATIHKHNKNNKIHAKAIILPTIKMPKQGIFGPCVG